MSGLITSGEWAYQESPGEANLGRIVLADGSDWIVSLRHNGTAMPARQNANGRLMAAAPRLLALLGEVMGIGDRLVKDVYGVDFVARVDALVAEIQGTPAGAAE